MKASLYPLLFKPLLKELIWGGDEMFPFKGLPPTSQTIGESWELSHVEGDYSVVANGFLAGKDIDCLIRAYGVELLGQRAVERTGKKFPLLVKFIDARQDLSVQVHPDDALAQARHNSFGKTEMWYIVKAKPEACLYSGFSRRLTPDEYVRLVETDAVLEALQRFEVKAGDVFYLPAGRVHAIGAGCFIAEIQQTSDITYRIYDYNRLDDEGKPRELHTALAKDAIDYRLYSDLKTEYVPAPEVELVKCKYFTTRLLRLEAEIVRALPYGETFTVYICTRGAAVVTDNNGYAVSVRQGQTLLLPACLESVTIAPSVRTEFLEAMV